jgi:nickel-dependent lactate racemase
MFGLNFGEAKVEFDLPGGKLLGILQGPSMPAVLDAPAAVLSALSSPTQLPPLDQFVRAGEKVVICVPDKTRWVKADIILPRVLRVLNETGVADKDISIVLACGTHALHTRAEQEKIVGGEVASRIKLVDHDCKNQRNLVKVGTTVRGNEIYVNKLVAEADRRILIGGITYHYFAGYTGGRKMILPGVAGYDTIQRNHKFVLEEIKRFSRRTFAVCGNLRDNPVHLDMLEAAKMLGPTFSLNVVLAPDKQLGGVFAGEVAAAHAAGCAFLDRFARVTVKEKADLIIVSGGGHPKDIDFVQSHKAMENASYVLKEGGVMVVLAEAAAGFPYPEYETWANLGSAKAIMSDLYREFLISKHTVNAAVSKAERFKIAWLTKMDAAHVKKMQMHPFLSFADALKFARQFLPPDFTYYILPDGSNTLPVIAAPESS